MVLRQLDIHMQKNEVVSYLTQNIRINSKWIENLSIRAKTIILIEEHIGVNPQDLGFLDMTP